MGPDGHFGPPDGAFAGHMGPPFGMFLAMGLSTLFWLGVFTVLALVAWRWWRRRRRPAAVLTAASDDELPAIELLRRRYVLGEIDADTFEQMVEHVLASELSERSALNRRMLYE